MDRSHSPAISSTAANLRIWFPVILTAIAAIIALWIGLRYNSLAHDAPLLTDSTLAELAVWISDQSENDSPPSPLAAFARSLSDDGPADPNAVIDVMQALFLVWCVCTALLGGASIWGLIRQAAWTRSLLLGAVIGLDALLFLIPTVDGENALMTVVAAIVLILVALLAAPGRVTNVVGFMVAISALLVFWESGKTVATRLDYAITAPQKAWTYSTYPTLDDALQALENGEIGVVVADNRELAALMPGYPDGAPPETPVYPTLRHMARLQQQEKVFVFSMTPALPGRLGYAVRAAETANYTRPSHFIDTPIGAVEGGFAATQYLAVPRRLVLLNLKILNDLNLPHLQVIAEAFLQPARRNGEFLLIRILSEAGLYTWREAVLGFGFGVTLGLLLGTFFAHSRLMERALLPYVVASQTVPILAIAPMVVIWLGASFTSVAVIAAYITFFPVTINTLRGLKSPDPTAVELMQSYAANWWSTLWKLRFPAAVPYIFTALKVSATASVVGAIIGELPSGIADGLGRAIMNFSSDYSTVSTPKLWAAIITAAAVGLMFFLIVTLVERVALRRYIRGS